MPLTTITQKQLVNQKKPEQENVLIKTRQTMQVLQFLPNTETVPFGIQDHYSVVNIEYGNQAKDISGVLSYIAESISKDELKSLISYLKQKQLITQPILERKEKMHLLPPIRRQFLSKYPTAAISQLLLQQNQEDPYDNMNILGDSVLEYGLAEIIQNKPTRPKKKKILTPSPSQKVEREQLRQRQLQELEDQYGDMSILGDSVLEYGLAEMIQNKPTRPKKKKILEPSPSQKVEREQLRQRQLQELEDQYGNMSILGDSVLEYDIRKVPDRIHNKHQKQQHKKREVLTLEQKVAREELRQLQLQEQEDLYDQMDLLGETIQKFIPLQSNTSSHKSIVDDASQPYSNISTPSQATPQTSSEPRRTSKNLSPEQVAQLAKIRRKRYEQQDREYLQGELLGESSAIELKDKYSFRRPNARLQSPRELVFRKSIVNVKENQQRHSKALALPVMNFPPTNWPTPIMPVVRLDLDKLRAEQRQYFLSMQQAALQRSQYPNQSKDQSKSIAQRQNLMSTQNEQDNPRQNQNEHRRNSIHFDDEENLSSKEKHHKVMKYLYIILFVQWSLITGIVSIFNYYEPASLWLKSSGDWTWLYILCTLNLVVIFLIVFPVTRTNYPINLIMLTLFMLLVAFMLSFVEIYYRNDAVLLALGCTCGICLVFALFFCQSRYNFTIFGGLCMCSIIIISVLGIFYLLIDVIVLDIVYAAIAVILYSIYLVCNTRAIVKEKCKFDVESDNYILDAIHLNLDFIFIIVKKIQCSL